MSAGPRRAFRLSGGGNDFLALVEPESPPDAPTIRAWCARGLGLGADGLFVLSRSQGVVRMDHFNADGGAADLCINGARCAARLAAHLGWIESEVTLATGAGPVEATLGTGDTVALALAPPEEPPRRREPTVGGEAVGGWLVTVGVPHFVVEWPRSLAAAPLAELGPPLRAHPNLGPAGANVDLVRFLPPHRLEIRSWERGVEGETLACGTGVLAAAAVALAEHRLEPPVEALTRGGFTLTVDAALRPDGGIERWTLAGDARLVATVEIHPGASRLPDPPAWSPD